MTINKLIYKLKKDKTMTIVHPVDSTTEQCLERVLKEEGKDGVEYYAVVPQHLIPQNREWRESWVYDKKRKKIVEDMEKCQEIHLQRLREWRNNKLKELDYDSMRAIEDDDRKKLSEIKRKKQDLRDLPDTVDFSYCETPYDISMVGMDDEDFGFDGFGG